MYLTPCEGVMSKFLSSVPTSSLKWFESLVSSFGDNLRAAARVAVRGDALTASPKLFVCRLLLRESLNIITGEAIRSLSRNPVWEPIGDSALSCDSTVDAELHKEVIIIGKRMSSWDPLSATICSKFNNVWIDSKDLIVIVYWSDLFIHGIEFVSDISRQNQAQHRSQELFFD